LFSFSVCRFAFGLLLSLCFLCGTVVVTDVKLVWLGWMVYLPIADLCCHIVMFNPSDLAEYLNSNDVEEHPEGRKSTRLSASTCLR
jgi:hypothetical protein